MEDKKLVHIKRDDTDDSNPAFCGFVWSLALKHKVFIDEAHTVNDAGWHLNRWHEKYEYCQACINSKEYALDLLGNTEM